MYGVRYWVLLAAALFCIGCEGPEIERRSVAFESAGNEVKVLSVNLGGGPDPAGEQAWENRRDAVFDLLADHGADVVCLQEATGVQVQELQRALPVYRAAGLGTEQTEAAGQTCPVLYRRDRFTAAEEGVFWFSNTPWVAGSSHWGNERPRACSWVRLTNPETGRGFFVYNLQLDGTSGVSREKSACLLVRQIARRRPAEPVVVAGDFQDNAGSRTVRILRGEIPTAGAEGVRLEDTWLPAGLEAREEGTYHAFQGRSEGARTDLILTGPEAETVWAEIDRRTFSGRYPSAHFPVAAMIRLPQE